LGGEHSGVLSVMPQNAAWCSKMLRVIELRVPHEDLYAAK
jgi:hypothetical protein